MSRTRGVTIQVTDQVTIVTPLVTPICQKFTRTIQYLEPVLTAQFSRPLPPNIRRKGSGKQACEWFNIGCGVNFWA